MPRHEVLTANMSELVRNDERDGKPNLVVPTAMIREGVWNGLYYPASELEKFPQAWDGRAAVLYHPEDADGQSVSANSKAQLEESIGVLLATNYDKDTTKLLTEAWIDSEKAATTDAGKAMLEKLEKNENVEVSTGLWVEVVDEQGTFDGERYDGIAINYRPDHLAILPDGIGACSVKDGAGMLRANMRAEAERAKAKNGVATDENTGLLHRIWDSLRGRSGMTGDSDRSLDERRRALGQLVQDRFGDADTYVWISDMYESYVVVNVGEKYFRIDYTLQDGKPVLDDGEPTEVERQVTFVPVTNENKQEDNTMDRDKTIADLIETGAFNDDDKDYLAALSDERLAGFAEKLTANDDEQEADQKADEQEQEDNPPETPAANEDKPKTVDEYLADMPKEVADMFRANMKETTDRKSSLVAALVKNAKCKLDADQLGALELEALDAMATLAEIDTSFEGNDPGDAPATNAPKGNAMPKLDWKTGEIATD